MKNTKSLIIKITVFLSIFALLSLIGTYAAWIWRSEVDKDVVFNTSKELQEYIVYNAGNSKFIGDFDIEDSFCESQYTTLSFYKTEEAANIPISATINMDINGIGSNISSSSDVYWVLTEGDSEITCTDGLSSANVVSYSNFIGTSAGQTISLKTNIPVTTNEQKFTVWIWIDSNGSNLSSLTGETLDVNIWTQIDMLPQEEQSGSITPVLDAGMIPVTISSTGVVTTILETDSNWYNYDNKKWANAILVSNSSRSTYKNTTGVTVTDSDILAYYVWIPRYKYKIWTLGTTSSPQTIDIAFESAAAAMSLGTTVGSYRTHPAFWWDNDSDGTVDSGETVAGFWAGKFETTGSWDKPTILPDELSLRLQTVRGQFDSSQLFSVSGNTYGLSNTSTNAHMMKNSEWGAVVYLSHSKYGINQEIYINNSSGFLTGRSGGNVSGSVLRLYDQYSGLTSSSLKYNDKGYYSWIGKTINVNGVIGDYASNVTLGTKASTTGNVTGIYDMSGGTFEYVMGNYNDQISSAGFSTMPATKYYDKYTTDDPKTACGGSVCFGHALSETAGWYNDDTTMSKSVSAWLIRGGEFSSSVGANSGAFSFTAYSGGASGYAWRSVLVVGFGA